MNDWLSEYKKIAKVALRKKPALLEKIGINASKHKPSKKKNNADNPPAK